MSNKALVSLSRPAAEEKISQSVPVPEKKIGWLVGKRGSYVKQLSQKSGAQISISESTSTEFGMVWKYVQITGTGRAVDRAKKLIHIRLSRLMTNSGGEGARSSGESDSSKPSSAKSSPHYRPSSTKPRSPPASASSSTSTSMKICRGEEISAPEGEQDPAATSSAAAGPPSLPSSA